MAADDKHRQQLSTLPKVLQFKAMSFVSPENVASTVTPLSRRFKTLFEENDFWNSYLKSNHRVRPDDKVTAKEIYQKYPERRLPQYYPKTITLRGEAGADICRGILNKEPNNLDAQSRLAFLIAMRETRFRAGDFPNIQFPAAIRENVDAKAWMVLQNIYDSHPLHLDNLYHLGKRLEEFSSAEEYNAVPLSERMKAILGLYREIIEQFPEHTEALYALGNMADRYAQALADEEEVTEDERFLTLENAAQCYRKTLLHNPYHEDALCSLAEAIQENRIVAEQADFLSEEKISTSNAQNAATLYRRILARNPKHIEALCNLAHLIRNREIDVQAGDFLGRIPDTRLKQMIELLKRANKAYEEKLSVPPQNITALLEAVFNGPISYRRQGNKIADLEWIIHKEKLLNQHFLFTIWGEIEGERLIKNYENLTAAQKDKLLEIVVNAHNAGEDSNKNIKRLIAFVLWVSGIICPVLLFNYSNLDPFSLFSASEEVAIISLMLVFICTFNLLNLLVHLSSNKYIQHKIMAKQIDAELQNPENFNIFFPGLVGNEIKAVKQLWKIPDEKWVGINKKQFINDFANLTAERKRRILASQGNANIDRKVAAAKFTGSLLSVIFPLGILAASGYGMYQTFLQELPTHYLSTIAIEGCVGILVAIMAYWAINHYVTPALIDRAESEQTDQIMQAIQAETQNVP